MLEFIVSSFGKDLARWRQDAAAILLWLTIPLMIGGLITSLIDGGGGAKPKGVLLIADQDDTFLSGLVAGAYSQGELGELIIVEEVTAEQGRAKIDAGEASGILVIPEGFSSAFLNSEAVTLKLVTNPSQILLPGIITNVTEVLLDAGFYAQRLFGEEIRAITEMTDGGVADENQVAALSIAIQQKIEAAAPQLFPPVIEIEFSEPPSDQPEVPFSLLFLPGIILMAVMFSANGLAGDYWEERELGTLRRLVCCPGQLHGFLAGKVLAAGAVIALIGGLTLAIGFVYHGIDWLRFPSSLAWLTVSGMALFACFGALQMLAPNRKSANLFTSLLMFPLLMIGGSFFPFTALPDWLAAMGRKTPNGFIADRLTNEITAGAAWSIDGFSWAVILAMGGGALLVCAWRLQSGFARNPA